jgi:hypothetical protein
MKELPMIHAGDLRSWLKRLEQDFDPRSRHCAGKAIDCLVRLGYDVDCTSKGLAVSARTKRGDGYLATPVGLYRYAEGVFLGFDLRSLKNEDIQREQILKIESWNVDGFRWLNANSNGFPQFSIKGLAEPAVFASFEELAKRLRDRLGTMH